MSNIDQESALAQKDFALVKIPGRHWTYPHGKGYKTGQRARFMWMPVSKRAIIYFQLAVYECNDPKLQQEVRKVFSTNRLKISCVYKGSMEWIYCSRLKDIEMVVELLDGMEKLFKIGYENGPFKKVMAQNPSTADYWRLIQCIENEENSRVGKRFMRTFTNAMSETCKQLLVLA